MRRRLVLQTVISLQRGGNASLTPFFSVLSQDLRHCYQIKSMGPGSEKLQVTEDSA
jgi:hypothetical protein